MVNIPLERDLAKILESRPEVADVLALRDALRTVQDMLLGLPGGVDLDADPDDDSPKMRQQRAMKRLRARYIVTPSLADAVAHVAGLAVQEIDKVLAGD